MHAKQNIIAILLFCVACSTYTMSHFVKNVLNKKTGHKCKSWDIDSNKTCIEGTQQAYYFYKNLHNDGSIHADILYFNGNVNGENKGLVIADRAIIVGEKSTIFQQLLVNTAEMHLLSPKTKVQLCPMATEIGALYKNGNYMGGIRCWLEKMNYGELIISDWRTIDDGLETKIFTTHTFEGYFQNLSDALNNGINATESIDNFLHYLKKNVKEKEFPAKKEASLLS